MNSKFPITELAVYGFNREIVESLRADGVQHLLPLQSQALASTGLLRGANVLALAPTSAGKTLLGELAALRHWQAGRKAIFLCPTRALTAEQFRHLQRRYTPAGIRVAMSTADYTSQDDLIRRGEFDFAVMVYEKLRAFVVTRPDIVYSLGVVVADELQILHDPRRGETADLLLTRLSRSESAVQIVGLSAVLDDGKEVADWLDAELLTSAARPSVLREGTWCTQHACFHYSAAADQWEDEEIPGATAIDMAASGLPASDGITKAAELATAIARSGENCLLFVPTRALSRQLAMAIAHELGISADAGACPCPELQLAEESLVRTQLLQCLPAGVAFHNSDLTAELRTLVESQFNAGAVRVLIATPTLAQGVNLRAKNVIHIPVMLAGQTTAGAPAQRRPQVALSVDRYKNQAGRAGRLGTGDAFGRSILIARTHSEAARLARHYIQAETAPPSRHCSAQNMEQFILDFVDAGIATSFSTLMDAMVHSFGWRSVADSLDESTQQALAECVRQLLEWELLEETPGHRLRVTGLGQAAAAGGFQAATIREMLAWCRAWPEHSPGAFEILLACAFTADAEEFPVSVTPEEWRSGRWMRAAEKALRRENAWEADHIQSALRPGGGLSSARHAMLKLAVICSGWISPRETADLEQEFRLTAGTLGAAAAHLAWLAGGLASCARIASCKDETAARIQQLAARLPQGLAPSAAGLTDIHIPGLTRNYLHRLAAAGFDSQKALKSADSETLSKIIPREIARQIHANFEPSPLNSVPTAPQSCTGSNAEPARIREPITTSAPATHTALPAPGVSAAPEAPPYELILDSADPGTVIFRGKKVQLSPKPYALLGLLARRCGTTVAYTEIDQDVWPDEKVEPQQISAHKSKLIKELAKVTSRPEAERTIVTLPRYGLRLNLAPARVRAR
jgi:helicase